MEVKGTIYSINEPEQITEKFRKQTVVIKTEDNPEYPQYISLETINDKISLTENLKEGQEITAHFNLNGRLWTNPQGVEKCFNTLQIWKVEAEELKPKENQQEQVDKGDLPF